MFNPFVLFQNLHRYSLQISILIPISILILLIDSLIDTTLHNLVQKDMTWKDSTLIFLLLLCRNNKLNCCPSFLYMREEPLLQMSDQQMSGGDVP